MSNTRRSLGLGALLAVLWFVAQDSDAQSLGVGVQGGGGLPIPVAGVETILQTGYPASGNGSVNAAGFWWSQTPCLGAVKIKFFRPSNDVPGGEFIYLDQRGPFDVTTEQQTVRLDPPVSLHAGDLIAITNMTSCGAPLTAEPIGPPELPSPPLPPYYAVPGDVVSNIVPSTPVPTSGPAVYLYAVDQGLTLLKGRFEIFLSAVDSRTGTASSGFPVPLGEGSGYFSLPYFTNDSSFPEVVVKMVDATGSPALGGGFWFFHAPLTDLQYTIKVLDKKAGTIRTYSNSSGGPNQLCGGVDTSAFPGP